MSNDKSSILSNIDFIQSLFDISWILMDYVRDKRYPIDESSPIKPKKDVPQEVLQAIVNLNAITSNVLIQYNKPQEDFDGEIPETLIDEIEISKE